MKLSATQSFDINCLKGALLINENGAEFFITSVQFKILGDQVLPKIYVELNDGSSVDWESIQNWHIQFQGGQK